MNGKIAEHVPEKISVPWDRGAHGVENMHAYAASLFEAILAPDPADDNPVLDALRADPAEIMVQAGYTPDDWQRDLLRSDAQRILIVASRQIGKTRSSAAIALREALLNKRALVLIISPSERQSGEIFNNVCEYYDALGKPVPTRKRTELQLHLTNGSRIIALPDNERTIRVYSGVKLLLIDEAARVPDELYHTVRPMLATSKGKLLALSTPFGCRGWLWEAWEKGTEWFKVQVRAEDCLRIPKEFLAEELASMGPRWFSQEYGLSFLAAVGSLFSPEDIAAAQGQVETFF